MSTTYFIAGDWGTSSLRLYLCSKTGVLDSKTGPGIAKLTRTPPEVMFDLIEDWTAAHGMLPIFLIGMAGSNIGWVTVPYISSPASLESFGNSISKLKHKEQDIYIAGGVSTLNPLGSPDVMRGEETQIFGALSIIPELEVGRHLICLPGTHTKWVVVDNGDIQVFHTAFTGELFDILSNHSVLLKGVEQDNVFHEKYFLRGVVRCAEIADTDLLHVLFEVRSKQIAGLLCASTASNFLSGLLIGQDVKGALTLFPEESMQTITLVGTPALTQPYQVAIEAFGMSASEIDGNSASLAGLRALAKDYLS